MTRTMIADYEHGEHNADDAADDDTNGNTTDYDDGENGYRDDGGDVGHDDGCMLLMIMSMANIVSTTIKSGVGSDRCL